MTHANSRTSRRHRAPRRGLPASVLLAAALIALGVGLCTPALAPAMALPPPSTTPAPAPSPSPTPPPDVGDADEPDPDPLTTSPAKPAEVVIFCDVPPEFVEPLVEVFQRRTRIRVRPIYPARNDTPADPAERLAADHAAGRREIDVWWSRDLARTLWLTNQGLLEPPSVQPPEPNAPLPPADPGPEALRASDLAWSGVGRTLHVVAYHTMLVNPADLPDDLAALGDKKWAGRVGIADPARSGSRTLLAALHSLENGQWLDRWLPSLASSGARVFPTDAELIDALATGRIALAITDSATLFAAARQPQPLRARLLAGSRITASLTAADGELRIDPGLTQGLHAAALLRNAPNRDPALQFLDYLLCNEAAGILAAAPGELLRHGRHPSPGFGRWIDGVPKDARRAPVSVSITAFSAGTLADHDAAAMAAWRRAWSPAPPPEPARKIQ